MGTPLVVAVILNTNRRDDTLACLASLARSTYLRHTAIVLDNACTDGSSEAIRAAFPDVEILPLAKNLGYAGNNNVGIRAALDQGADWVLVLNEDTVLDPDCLTHLVEAGEQRSDAGILGPMVYHYDEPDIIQSAGRKLGLAWEASHFGQNERDLGQFREPRPVDGVTGCAIMVRRAAIEQAGTIDERFFYYWEETEWCLRVSRYGWRIFHVPRARLWHKGVQRDYRPTPNVTYYDTRNRLLMMAKHRAPLWAWLVVSQQTARTLVSWTVRTKWRSMREHRDAMWQGTTDFLRRRWGMRPT